MVAHIKSLSTGAGSRYAFKAELLQGPSITGLQVATRAANSDATTGTGAWRFADAEAHKGLGGSSDPLVLIPSPEAAPPVGPEAITGTNFDDNLVGTAADETLEGLERNDTLNGRGGNDLLDGGDGDDTVSYVDATSGVLVFLNRNTATDGEGGADTLVSIEHATGSAFNDVLIGDERQNLLVGGQGADVLIGNGGNDYLEGGSGAANSLYGGAGDDTYTVSAYDTIVEAANEGFDHVRTALNYFRLPANVEALSFTGAGAFTGIGGTTNNYITGGVGADLLMGMGGDDYLDGGVAGGAANTLIGGTGDDRYYINTVGDSVLELANEGTDYVFSYVSTFRLSANVEYLFSFFNGAFTGFGSATDNTIFGGNGALAADYLSGGDGNDTIYGGTGAANTLVGGRGDDIYYDQANDTIIEAADEGIDQVVTYRNNFVLKANVENVRFDGDGNFSGAGNNLDNVIQGRDGHDTLRGNGGNDTLNGGSGRDTADMSGNASEYTIVNLNNGQYRITDSVGGRDGVDTLSGMEQVRFADGVVVQLSSIQPSPIPEQASKGGLEPQVLPGITDDGLGDLADIDPGVLSDMAQLIGRFSLRLDQDEGHMMSPGDAGLVDPRTTAMDPMHDHWLL